MALPETTAPKLFARDIAAYSDAELNRYLEENGRYVDVEDPENLPGDFIQRLKDRTHRVSESADFHPIDLDEVAARLQEQSRRSPSLGTTAPYDSEEDYQLDLEHETRSYNMLVDNGGRPSHPLSRLEDIANDPGEYREILSFWQSREDEWRVFGGQFGRWRAFRRLQRFARGQRDYDYWRSIWEEDRELHIIENMTIPYWLGATPYIRWEWFVKREGQTTERQGFPEYVEALKERLAKHGFTRTFQLEEDAARQDKMTTWIEYLGYEYWWYDRYAGTARDLQKRRDNAWKKLVDSGVLRLGETEEVLRDDNVSVRDEQEKERAERAVQSAMSAVSSAETAMAKLHMSRLSPQTLQQQLSAARSRLEMVQEEYKSLDRRSCCITEFYHRVGGYRVAKRNAERHEVLLRWMLQQVPLIEGELNAPNESGSNKSGGRNMLKRSRSEELDEGRHAAAVTSPEPLSKRARRTATSSRKAVSNSANPISSTRTLEVSIAPKTDSKPEGVKGSASSDRVPRIWKPLRRSPRIAERESLHAAIASAALTHGPMPTSSTLSKTRRGKRGQREMAGRRHISKTQGVKKKGRTRW